MSTSSKSRRITLTIEMEFPAGTSNKKLMREVKPALELAIRREAPVGAKVVKTTVTRTE